MRAPTFGAGLRNRRVLALLTAFTVMAGIILVIAPRAQAHNNEVNHDCGGWSVDLTYYNGANTLVVKVDGNEVVNTSFGTGEHKSGTWSKTSDHTIWVEVTAHDDPNFDRGWSFVYEGSEKACEQISSTSSSIDTTTSSSIQDTSTSSEQTSTTEGQTVVSYSVLPYCDTSTSPAYGILITADMGVTVVIPKLSESPFIGPWVNYLQEANALESYPYTVEVADGYVLSDGLETSGSLVVEDCAEALPTTITAPPSTEPEVEVTETLPFTGFDGGTMGLFAIALLGGGVALLVAARYREE